MRFNGINPSEISPKIFVSHEIINAIPPRSLRMATTSEQSYLAGVDILPREIHLYLNFAGKSHEHANSLARRVAALFCTSELGEYEPTHHPGKALSVVLQSASEMEWKWGFGTIEYVFIAPRPYYHSTSETVIIGEDSINIEPQSSVPVRPMITHTMIAAADALEISVGSFIVMRIRNPLGTQLQAGQVIKVDFANRLVLIAGETSMAYVDYTASDWHPKILGATTIGISDAGPTEVRWRDEWM